MKAAVLEKLHSPLTVSEVIPEACEEPYLEFGQVFVRMLCAGLCGAQIQEIEGSKGDPLHLPHLLGHEGCGIVEDIGDGVSRVKKGDKAILHWRKGAGCDVGGGSYIGGIKSGPLTCFSEYTIISENRCTAIPRDVPDDFACLLGCCLSTALGVIENEAKVRFGESVLIIGCGGLGLSLILAAKLANAFPIHAVDLKCEKNQLANDVGADGFTWGSCIDEYPVEKFDIVIDTTGTAPYLDLLAPGGRYVLVGQPKALPISIPISRKFVDNGNTITSSQGGCFSPTEDIPRYVKLWRSGAFERRFSDSQGECQYETLYENIITHRLPLDRINEGIDLMRQGKAGRVLIEFDK